MEIQGLDYNTQREKLRLMAYGRDIQQMVDIAQALPTKEERQKAAKSIIDAMKRVVPSQQSNKERIPVLWYHLALMSNFQLDIDYPVEIIHEDKMAIKPAHIDYNKSRMKAKHYGRLLTHIFDTLKEMPDGEERESLINLAAVQMYRCLTMWGGNADNDKIASDLARYTDGVIQVDPASLKLRQRGRKKKK